MTIYINGNDGISGPNTSVGGMGPSTTVATLNDLKALVSRPPYVELAGFNTINDNSGGSFYWIPNDSTVANDGIYIQCTSGPSGRYRRIFNGEINVKWFGATGNGVVEDTVAIQNAIEALPTTGGVLIIPSGTYIVSNLYLNGLSRNKSNVTIRGTGLNTILKLKNNAGAVNLIDGEGAVKCIVENLLLDGNRTNQIIPVLVDGPDYENYNGIYLENSSDCIVHNCYIKNMAVIGICPGAPHVAKLGADRCKVIKNTFENCTVAIAAMKQRKNTLSQNNIFGTGQIYAITVDEFSTNNEISDNIIDSTTNVSIFLFRATNNIVSSNRIDNCLVSIGISDASVDNLIDGNHCTNSSNSHIKLVNACDRNSIINNILELASQYCIVADPGTGGSHRLFISNNKCRKAGYSNIGIFNSGWTLIENNYVWEANGSGIYVSGTCDWSKVAGNYCYNNGLTSAGEGGIRLIGQNNITIENNKCFDSEGSKTQTYGIRGNESSMGTCTIINNDVRYNLTSGMALSGTPIVKRNMGWITENAGSVTLLAGNTGVSVTHGMDMIPDYRTIKITGLNPTTNTKCIQIGNVTATTFDIYADAAPGGSGLLIGWTAEFMI